MRRAWEEGNGRRQIEVRLLEEALSLEREEEEAAEKMGQYGAELLADGDLVLTHCNSGSLATAGVGTALGVIKVAHQQGKHIQVLVSETRPLLQGARLTAWELKQEGIPFILITDSMAGYFMKKGGVKAVLVGADRIAANGDSANKIGTYTLAVLAMEHGVPFYVAAPTSTVDLSLASGEEIPIEERYAREVTHIAGASMAPRGTRAANPAFDVTPHYYISAIITEKGILREPYEERLKKALGVQNA
jgi:methylthioribose-1-phosphate isomerase